MRSPEVGGSAVLTALETARKHVATGRYFRVAAEPKPQPQAADEAFARVLWERGIAGVKISFFR